MRKLMAAALLIIIVVLGEDVARAGGDTTGTGCEVPATWPVVDQCSLEEGCIWRCRMLLQLCEYDIAHACMDHCDCTPWSCNQSCWDACYWANVDQCLDEAELCLRRCEENPRW